MALIHCDFFSHTLQLMSSVVVILPQPAPGRPGVIPKARQRRYPVLYLLHGLSDDHTVWTRRTNIERYVEGMKLAVVMPAVHRSFYANMSGSGFRYWTYISEELPNLMRSLFPISAKREDTFAAGLSMGGYGAFKLALTHPDRFAAAASLSGALNVGDSRRIPDPEFRGEMTRIFGDLRKLKNSQNDLLALAGQASVSGRRTPQLFQWCGREDFLYHDNLVFRDHALNLGLNLTYSEGPGEHEWGAWDHMIQHVLEWLPLN